MLAHEFSVHDIQHYCSRITARKGPDLLRPVVECRDHDRTVNRDCLFRKVFLSLDDSRYPEIHGFYICSSPFTKTPVKKEEKTRHKGHEPFY